jgi:hypothetical protein
MHLSVSQGGVRGVPADRGRFARGAFCLSPRLLGEVSRELLTSGRGELGTPSPSATFTSSDSISCSDLFAERKINSMFISSPTLIVPQFLPQRYVFSTSLRPIPPFGLRWSYCRTHRGGT